MGSEVCKSRSSWVSSSAGPVCRKQRLSASDWVYAHHAIQDSLEFSDNEIYDYVDRQIEYFTEQLGDIDKVLELEKDATAFVRKVNLIGRTTNKEYASAESLLNPALIGTDLFRALTDEGVGMGEVLRNNARGSYREIINIDDTLTKIAERTYAVYLDGRPSILITEAFIIDNF